MVNMSAKFEEEAHISFVCIRFKAYRITRNFRENLIFAIFANDLKTRKYVSVKNCTLKESLEVDTGMIFCCIPCLIGNPDINQGFFWCNYYMYTNNLYKTGIINWWPKPRMPSDYNYMYLASLIGD